MAIYTDPPEWEAEGRKPPSSKRAEGWKPKDRVPASWLNWFWFSTVRSLKEIAQALVGHRESRTDTHGIEAPYYIAKTARGDQLVGWDDVVEKPSEFPPGPRYYTKEEVNELVGGSLPRGIIAMWSGAINNVPGGWALCDGSNGTPDLRDRFVVGAGASYSVGDMGGAATVTLNISHLPPHAHTVPNVANATTIINAGAGAGSSYHVSGSVTRTTSSVGEGHPHENRPPYYALAYIMKL